MGHDPTNVVVQSQDKFYAQIANTRGLHWQSDEPIDLGGQDTGPTPYELLLSALGSCTSITCQMYADRKGWPLDSVTVRLDHTKQKQENNEPVDVITKTVEFAGELTDDQRKRLREIADRCPVHRTLLGNLTISAAE